LTTHAVSPVSDVNPVSQVNAVDPGSDVIAVSTVNYSEPGESRRSRGGVIRGDDFLCWCGASPLRLGCGQSAGCRVQGAGAVGRGARGEW